MTNHSVANLRGMTWNHDRGIAPLLASSSAFFADMPDVDISWNARPLQDFESQPIRELAATYDLIIIDHPHLGEAVRENLLLNFSDLGHDQELAQAARQSVGASHASYSILDGQWALAVDAATPVASYRPDRIGFAPQDWTDVMKLARAGDVIMPLRPPHSLMAFFWLARNRGYSIAENSDRFMDRADLMATLEQLSELASHLDPNWFDMDPINVYDMMSTRQDAPAYCPHAYGYISYARNGFRPHILNFVNVADAAGGGVAGTVLGGTGIAVSALSNHQELATEFAFYAAGEICQSEIWVQNGGQPGHAAAWQNRDCNFISNNFLKNTRATIDAAWVRPRYRGYLSFQSNSSELISEYLKGAINLSSLPEALENQYRSSYQ